MPRIFLSYSWESESHRDWVRNLASDLTNAGIEVHLDQWDLSAGESVTAFMEQEVAKADYIVAICTPTFASKSEKRTGGVGYEQQIISGALLSGTPRSKFIPILRSGDLDGQDRAIPLHFSGTFFLDSRDDSNYATSLEQLVRAIFQSPKYQRPTIGKPPEYVQSDKTSPTSQTNLYIHLNSEYRIEDSDSELLAYEIARILSSGGTPRFTFYTPGYSDEKTELSQSTDIPPQRKLELLRAVDGKKILGQDRDSILNESLMLLINHVYPQLQLLHTPSLAYQSISKVIERWSLSHSSFGSSTKFDVVHRNSRWSFGIYLSATETEELEKREKVGQMSLTLDWGLHIFLLDPTIIREKVVPGMIQEFLWQKYRYKTSPDPDEFFTFRDWQVGIA